MVAADLQGSSLLTNDGAGVLTASVLPLAAQDTACSDQDLDGDDDLVAVDGTSLFVLFADGGGFVPGPQTFTAVNPRRLAVGDLDGDGLEDALTWHATNAPSVTRHLALGGGAFGATATLPISGYIPLETVALGDVDGNGLVDFGDVVALLADWGPCADCAACPADLDGDCTVGLGDLLEVLANWD